MKYFLTLIKHDFTTQAIRENHLLNMIISTLLLMISLYITNNQVNGNIIILPLAIACIIQGNIVFEKRHFLEQIIVSGCPCYIITIAKLFITYTKLCITTGIIWLVLILLGNISLESGNKVIYILLLYSIPIASVTVLSAALTLKTKNNQWLSLLISLPLILIFFMYLSPMLNFYLEPNSNTHIEGTLQIFATLSLISLVTSIYACSYLVTKI